MNVFILNTGRCGSTTFIQACRHIINYTALHESRLHRISALRLAYPENHIEADNRLSWYLGRLDREYGDNAFYVHLTRDRAETAASFTRRMDFGIMRAYKEGLLLGGEEELSAQDIALDYIETVGAYIALFLKDKQNKMDFRLERAKTDFRIFWDRIGAEGDLERALTEWDVSHNASKEETTTSFSQ